MFSHNSVIHVWPKLWGFCQKPEGQYCSVLQADGLHIAGDLFEADISALAPSNKPTPLTARDTKYS